MIRFSGAGVTDVGLVRSHNEDSGYLSPYVAIVADGVGGAAAGEVASATAAQVVLTHAHASFGLDPEAVVAEAVIKSRLALRAAVDADHSRTGMATTLTGLVTDGSRVVLVHLGDSRCYLLSRSRLTRISCDHTYVQRLVETGELAPEGVAGHRWRNVVLRSLHANTSMGIQPPDVLPLPVETGDRYLLCSDGLTDLVTETRIAEVLAIRDPQSAAARLVEDALVAGGTDNVTCLVLDVVDGPRVVADGQRIGALQDVGNLALPAAVRVTS